MEIVFATKNPIKIMNAYCVFLGSGINFTQPEHLGIRLKKRDEGATIEQNAFAKARWTHQNLVTPRWVIAEETGLYLEAIPGMPGAFTATWMGENMPGDQVVNHTLAKLRVHTNRTATFKSAVVAISPEGDHEFFLAETEGRMAMAPILPPTDWTPYDFIFKPNGYEVTLAELSMDEYAKVSHRGQALKKLRAFLEK